MFAATVMSTPSNGSDSDGSASAFHFRSPDNSLTDQNGIKLSLDEDIEPYVRRRRPPNDRSRKRLEKLSEEEQNLLRTSINSRERRRMHDLNDALDGLRSALPYSQGASVRRLSKINTIILASNCIRQLTKNFNELSSENEKLRLMIPEEKKANLGPPIQMSLPMEELLPKRRRISPSPQPTPPSTIIESLPTLLPPPSTRQSFVANPLSSILAPVFPMAFFNAFNRPPFPLLCAKRVNPLSLCFCTECVEKTTIGVPKSQ